MVQPASLKLSQEQQYVNLVKELFEDLKLEGVTLARSDKVLPIYLDNESVKARLKVNLVDSDSLDIVDGSNMLFNEDEENTEEELENDCFDILSPLLGGYGMKVSHLEEN